MAFAWTHRRGGTGRLTALLALLVWAWLAASCPVAAHPFDSLSAATQHQEHGSAPTAHLDAACGPQIHAAAIPARAPPEPAAGAGHPVPPLLPATAPEGMSLPRPAPFLDTHSPPVARARHAPLGAQAPPLA